MIQIDIMNKRLLFLTFFFLSVNAIEAQWNFDFKPPKERIQQTYSRKKIITNKVVKPKYRHKPHVVIDEHVFYETVTETKKSLEDMNDYQLEIESSKGNTEAQYLVGSRKIFSEDSIEFKVGMEYLKLVADQGNVEAMALLGFSYDSEGEMDKAVEYYQKAADQGNALGEYRLALCYSNGEGGLTENHNLAAQYFLQSARQGVAVAQVAIAMYLYLGIGLHRDLESSEKWMKMAADQGENYAIDFMQENDFTHDGVIQYINKHRKNLNLEIIETLSPSEKDNKKESKKNKRKKIS